MLEFGNRIKDRHGNDTVEVYEDVNGVLHRIGTLRRCHNDTEWHSYGIRCVNKQTLCSNEGFGDNLTAAKNYLRADYRDLQRHS